MWHLLKTRWKKMDHLMAGNITKIIKAAKWAKSYQKIFKKGLTPGFKL